MAAGPSSRTLRTFVAAALVVGMAAGLTAACASGGGAPDGPETRSLRVVTYNIRHGRGMDDRVDLERTAEVLQGLGPDIVALQEVDDGVERSGRTDQPERLGELLGMDHAFGSFFRHEGGEYGMALLSRYPIERVQRLRLTEGNEPRIALLVRVRPPGGAPLTVVNVHFDWVQDDAFRYAQAREVAEALDALDTPFLVLGDFNDAPASRTLELFRSRAREAQKPPAGRWTFPADRPERELDYIFAGPRAGVRFTETEVVDGTEIPGARTASDHRPLFAIYEEALGGRR